MNNRILNEVKRNRELMGLNESEVDEQLGTAIRQGIEKGKNFVKGLFNKNKPESDEGKNENTEEVEKYNNVPISDIIQDIKDMNKSRGKIVVNGETLYFGVGESSNREITRSKADLAARMAMKEDTGEETQSGVAPVIDELYQMDNGEYVRYILIKQF